MPRLTRPAAAALALCLVPMLLGPGTSHARPESTARVGLDRQQTIDSFYDRWLRNNQVPVGWTGNAATCTPGATSAASEAATIDQINFYRELVGSPPAALDQTHAAMPQRAALMMHANGALEHHPPPSWHCYQEPFSHNLLSGQPAASGITSYIHDWGPHNFPVGHRRALLNPLNTAFAVGSTDAFNAVLIAARAAGGTTTSGWVAWPPAGLVASPLVSTRWSFDTTRTDLDLTDAVATVSGPSGLSVPTVVDRSARGIVFEVPGDLQPPVGADASYHVTISGMTSAGVPAPDHTYTVTLVRPDRSVVPGAAPTVAGTARVGDTLTATPGTWATVGARSADGRWYRDGTRIAYSFGTSYDPSRKDIGHQIHYAEVGQADHYLPTAVSSTSVTIIEAEAPGTTATKTLDLLRRPRVRGTVKVGRTLTAVPGRWRPSATSTFTWVRNGRLVAKGKRLRLTKAYAGTKIVLRVTGKRAGYRPTVIKVRVGRVRR